MSRVKGVGGGGRFADSGKRAHHLDSFIDIIIPCHFWHHDGQVQVGTAVETEISITYRHAQLGTNRESSLVKPPVPCPAQMEGAASALHR